MSRSLACVAVVLILAAGPAYSQSSSRQPANTPTNASPDAMPDPLDVPRWMGHAIDDILTRDEPNKRTDPPRQ